MEEERNKLNPNNQAEKVLLLPQRTEQKTYPYSEEEKKAYESRMKKVLCDMALVLLENNRLNKD